MEVSKRGLEFIAQYEGCKLRPYLCDAGYWTIGIGMRFFPDGTEVSKDTDAISLKDANAHFEVMVSRYAKAVEKSLEELPRQCQFDAMVSLAYNVGVKSFNNSTLLKKHNEGDCKGAVMEFQRWSLSNGNRSLGLLRRRLDEARMYLE